MRDQLTEEPASTDPWVALASWSRPGNPMDEREIWKQRKQRKSDTKWGESMVKGFFGVQFERVLKFMHAMELES